MQKIQKHIEIVRSTTAALNSLGQKSSDAIYAILTRHYQEVGVSLVNSVADLERLVAKQPDLVFMGMKALSMEVSALQGAQRIWVSDYLDQHGIPYTGSGQRASEYDLNKPLAKQRVSDAGIKTSPFLVIKNGQPFADSDVTLRFPLFVKPASLGSGKGISGDSIVYNLADLRTKVASLAATYMSDILVEEFLPGREFSVGILKSEYSEELTVMPIELVGENNVPEGRILSEAAKSSNQSTILAITEPKLKAQVVEVAAQVFAAIDARDYGRIDIRLDRAGIPHFLEANLIPSLMDGYGSFPLSCALNIGMNHETMILHIVKLGLAHAQTFYEQEDLPSMASLTPVSALL